MPGDEAAIAAEREHKEAQRVLVTHGHRAEQHLVDEMQAALRAGDEEKARRHDGVLRRLQSL